MSTRTLSLEVDPAAYVPRLALESALAELGEVIGKTPGCAALSGNAGLGKTLLLRVLRERLQGAYECLVLPSPQLDADDVWRWAAQAIGLGAGEDDRGAALGRARRLGGEDSGLVLLVDDAGLLPPATRADLLAALDTPGFSLILAFDGTDSAQLDSLPAFVRRVELGPPMTLSETRSYVHALLRRADPEGALASRLSAERLAALHEASGGVPARLHGLLDAWLLDQAVRTRSAPVALPRTRPAAVPRPTLPEPLAAWAAHLRKPGVQLALMGLLVAAVLGAWLFAWRLSPGVSSVGVPVDQVAPRAGTPPAPAPGLAPAEAPSEPPAVGAGPTPTGQAPVPAEAAPALPEAGMETLPAEPAAEPAARQEQTPTAAETAAPEQVASAGPGVTSRPELTSDGTGLAAWRPAIAPALPATPPARDPRAVEAPVEVSSPPFPDEHVPEPIEPGPLAPPPAGPRLSVNAMPWAEVRLDGVPVGETPLGELQLAPGSHIVSAKLPDGRVLQRGVEVRAGDVYLVFP